MQKHPIHIVLFYGVLFLPLAPTLAQKNLDPHIVFEQCKKELKNIRNSARTTMENIANQYGQRIRRRIEDGREDLAILLHRAASHKVNQAAKAAKARLKAGGDSCVKLLIKLSADHLAEQLKMEITQIERLINDDEERSLRQLDDALNNVPPPPPPPPPGG